ncbi:MAG: ROK family protein [Bacteroidia bacterium]|nr:ROK family protein [Bacteroidia bacterium]
MEILGIDIGASGIKGSIVDTLNGKLLHERHRIPTPSPATPHQVAQTIRELVDHFGWRGLIGCGFPGVVQQGIARTAANVDKHWINTNIELLFGDATGLPVKAVNDADAAGLAECIFGAGHGRKGALLLLTVGTGIGSAFLMDGQLFPNTELGHLKFKGGPAEQYASDAARKREDLPWRDWAKRFNEYLNYVYSLFYPEIFIIGGGTSKKFDKFIEFIEVPCPVIPAELENSAGIVGAALAARALAHPGVE